MQINLQFSEREYLRAKLKDTIIIATLQGFPSEKFPFVSVCQRTIRLTKYQTLCDVGCLSPVCLIAYSYVLAVRCFITSVFGPRYIIVAGVNLTGEACALLEVDIFKSIYFSTP